MSTFSDYDNILIYNGADRGQTRGEKPKNEPQHMFAKGNTLGEDGVCALALKTKQCFHNPMLNDVEKQTIRAFATRQNSKREVWAADCIEGKGAGQIMLPRKPMNTSMTLANIETRVENELLKWFSLPEAWNAVLLVDEADIFLERRQNRDLARNGLVLAIGYQPFTPQDRLKLWQGFFHKLDRERADQIQIARGAKKWVLEKAESGGRGAAQRKKRHPATRCRRPITLAEAEAEYEEASPDFDSEKTTIVVGAVASTSKGSSRSVRSSTRTYVKSIRKEDEKKRAANRYD
ncbi:hypothetical protein CIB48_g10227 [Xylaria polymorpha]|nr:hypothetical protein CIB48_g10227 [Xylaria polymorpha]